MTFSAHQSDDPPVRSDGFVVDDLAALPEDGRRYELVDGALVVTPSPRWEHQYGASELGGILREACPPEFAVFAATPHVVQDQRTSLRPDVCVVRQADLVAGEPYRGVPLLVAEVLSPATEAIDLLLKHTLYEMIGAKSYWVVDVAEPSITVFELDVDGDVDGGGSGYSYVGLPTVRGDRPLRVARPFPVVLRPSDLSLARAAR
jgi:Uma2 family endonuclease